MRFAKKIFAVVTILSVASLATDRVAYANATLDIEPGARSAALGSATMAIDGDYVGLMGNPYQLARVDYTWLSLSHTAYYEDTQYDFFSAAIPLGSGHGLGVSLARFSAEDIPCIREGEDVPLGSYYNTMAISDWVLSVAWGKTLLKDLDVGASFHLIYRDMDQTGFGFRGDAGVRYRVVDQFFVSGLLKGWTSSATTWESGEFEYTSPEFYLASSYSLPVKYLYGSLNLYWQSAGVFHQEARDLDFDTDESAGGRIWEDPFDWLSGGRGGLEFNFDFGLSLRAGLSSFTTWESFTAGAGIVIADFLDVNYAFESHPVLSPVHRVSVSVSPYLFGHRRPNQGHLTPSNAAKTLLTEEPEESVENASAEALVEPQGEVPTTANDVNPQAAPAQEPEPQAVDAQKQQSAPVVENDDEVLESAPAGGMYWEE